MNATRWLSSVLALVLGGVLFTTCARQTSETISCKQSLDAYCTEDYCSPYSQGPCPTRCVRDLAVAMKPPCSSCTTGWAEIEQCGGFRVLECNGTDVGSAAYYDSSTGKLVAIVGWSNGNESCVGPSDFVIPPNSECGPQTACEAPDAGVDASIDGSVDAPDEGG